MIKNKLTKTYIFKQISKYDDIKYYMININENKIIRFIIDCNLDKLKVVEPPK